MYGLIRSLTGLRFVAAMMVFLSHYPIPGAPARLLQITQSGYAGVTVFFVLSGFVLAYNYGPRFAANGRGVLAAYALARFARVYPLYFIVTILVWLSSDQTVSIWPYLLMLQAWSPDLRIAYGLNGPSWSIGVEVFLYAVFPAVVLIQRKAGVSRSRGRILIAGSVIVIIMICMASGFILAGASVLDPSDPSSAHRWLYRTPLFRLFDFTLGVLVASFITDFAPGAIVKRAWELASYLAILAVVALMSSATHYYSAYSWDVSFAVPCVIVILALTICPNRPLARVLSLPCIVSLGEASYAFYLVHIPAAPMLRSMGVNPEASLGNYILFLGIVVCLAFGLHMIVERPARTFFRARLPHVQPIA
jgi:peptidoglycan/LPS O-acetylase OafA/YrhL